jgi:hypothetical protein
VTKDAAQLEHPDFLRSHHYLQLACIMFTPGTVGTRR